MVDTASMPALAPVHVRARVAVMENYRRERLGRRDVTRWDTFHGLANAWARYIADEVADGRTPSDFTVEAYRLLSAITTRASNRRLGRWEATRWDR